MADKSNIPSTPTPAAAAAPAAGYPAVPLFANSYDLGALLKAGEHAEGLKTPENRNAAFAAIAEKTAINQDVIAGKNAPAVPEGTQLQEVVGDAGVTTIAPVSVEKPTADAVDPTAPTND